MSSDIERKSLKAWRVSVFVETQAEFAARLGVKPSTVGSWERAGAQRTPRLRTKRQIAAALGVKVADIIWPGEEEDDAPAGPKVERPAA